MNESPRQHDRQDATQLRRELVREWQQPIYNLAYRLLGNEADAADATQEVFIRLLGKLDRYDPAQPLGPWVYRVATHRIRDLMRSQRSQRERDRRFRAQQVAVPHSASDADPAWLRREIESVLESEVAGLDEAARLPIVLHYYSGMTIAEIASTLELPSSTVHSRIQSGLGKLRGSLARLGFATVIPGGLTILVIEKAMRSSASLPVPAHTAAALSSLALASPTGMGAALIGGSLVKSSTTSFVVIAAASILIGLGIGRVAFSVDRDELGSTTSQGAQPVEVQSTIDSQLATLQEENRRLQEALTRAKSKTASLVAQLEQASTPSPAAEEEASADPSKQALALNWEKLSELLAKNVDLFRIQNVDDADLTEEEEASLEELREAWAQAGIAARAVTPYAFLDEEFLPEVLSVVLGATLGLSDQQLSSVSHQALELLAANPPNSETTPLEAYRIREQLIADLDPILESTLTAQQREDFEGVQKWVNRLLRGEQGIRILGLRENSTMRTRIRKAWRTAYGLERGQVERIDDYVDQYVTRHRAILERYGQLGKDPRELSRDERRALDREAVAVGLEIERTLLPYLTQEQRDQLPNNLPMLIRLQDDRSIIIGYTGYQGF